MKTNINQEFLVRWHFLSAKSFNDMKFGGRKIKFYGFRENTDINEIKLSVYTFLSSLPLNSIEKFIISVDSKEKLTDLYLHGTRTSKCKCPAYPTKMIELTEKIEIFEESIAV